MTCYLPTRQPSDLRKSGQRRPRSTSRTSSLVTVAVSKSRQSILPQNAGLRGAAPCGRHSRRSPSRLHRALHITRQITKATRSALEWQEVEIGIAEARPHLVGKWLPEGKGTRHYLCDYADSECSSRRMLSPTSSQTSLASTTS